MSTDNVANVASEESNENKESSEGKESEPPKRFAGVRKGILWLLGAGALAVVGYRGALGSTTIDATVELPAASAAEHRPPAVRAAVEPATPARAGALRGAATSRAADPPSAVDVLDPDSHGAAGAAVLPGAGASPGAATSQAAEPAATVPAPDSQGATPSAAVTPDGKIVLNLATETELRKLPGIGKARARAIVEQRERAGRFRRLEDLLRVKGIGPKRLAVLRPKLVLDAP